jgi:hypothetical protein
MRTIFDSAAPVKCDRPFGIVPTRERREPDTQADLDWAAQFYGDFGADRRLEVQARQGRWDDQFNRAFPAGLCQPCVEPSDRLDPVHELCPECMTATENATIAGENGRAGFGYRTF